MNKEAQQLYIKNNLQNWISVLKQLNKAANFGLMQEKTVQIIKGFLARIGFEIIDFNNGIIGVLKHGNSSRKLGLLAGIDANNFEELNLVKHACGHDGETIMLLAACQYLSETRNFNGTFYAIFQPSQINFKGAKYLIDQGMFNKINLDGLFSLKLIDINRTPNSGFSNFIIFDNKSKNDFKSATLNYQFFASTSNVNAKIRKSNPLICASNIILNLSSACYGSDAILNVANLTIDNLSTNAFNNDYYLSASLQLSISCEDDLVYEASLKRIKEIIINYANIFNCAFKENLIQDSYNLRNNIKAISFANRVLINCFGQQNIKVIQDLVYKSDFSLYRKFTRSAIIFLENANSIPMFDKDFYFLENQLPYGISFNIEMVENFLK
ncbi:MAG: amidohydrolase [Malacoplasma sp.]|nr:amidohydrolase [Malacoplasma sp.]